MVYVIAAVLFLSALISALPIATDSPSAPNDDILAEQWLISRLDMHIMSEGTGIPGNPTWPESMRFNSTINFDVVVPDYTINEDGSSRDPESLNCQTSWENGTLPELLVECTGGLPDETVWFEMREYTDLGDRRPELSFILDMGRISLEGDNVVSYLNGSIPITANDPSEPSSYLTCLQGAPYDGLRCEIKSYLSVDNELIINATSSLQPDDPTDGTINI
ncbi:Nn.00g094440.m01.CDS01 [Neocucurbitaria sp. VM-36]